MVKKSSSKEKKTTETPFAVVEDVANNILNLLGTNATLSVNSDNDNNAVILNIDAKEETGLLIGSRGKTIQDLQSVIGMIVKRKTGEWQRVIVNVGDWREKENSRLEDLAKQAAERAISTKEPQFLYNLTPAQRRVIHVFLSEYKGVQTESQGEGEGRYLIVSSK